MGVLTLNSKDQMKLDVIYKVLNGDLNRHDAAVILKVSQRTFERYLAEYRKRGVSFVKHGNVGKLPWNKTDEHFKETVLELMLTKYVDFNVVHAVEKLKQNENVIVARETLRRWCHGAKHLKNRRRRRGRPRFYRDRVSNPGIMLQMDGSYHEWYGGQSSCLLAAIDDADSRVKFGEFTDSETTFACLDFLKALIKKHGLFKVLYVDRAGVYGSHKRAQFTQVQRACDELGIQVVFASSPQAKGRIERLFRTLQDRLIPEMRLLNIQSRERANEYLKEVYIPHEHNPRFSVEPLNNKSMYVPILDIKKLDEILCFKEWRKINNDHTISIDSERYKIIENWGYSMARYFLEVRKYADGKMAAFFAQREIKIEKIEKTVKKMPA